MDGWRQIIKTPTFALGLSVVAAAVLAFGTTQTYLRFSGSGPSTSCGHVNCANPAASPSTSQPPGNTKAAAQAVRVSYRTVSASATGFTGELVITNRSAQNLASWHLSIGYQGSRITGLTGAQWQPRSHGASGTIGPAPPSGPLGAHQAVRISYTATGTPHAPASCDFNGVRCRIR